MPAATRQVAGVENLSSIRCVTPQEGYHFRALVIDFGPRPAHVKRLMIRVHGTSVALGGDGVLLRGPSGSGKSDLALRLIDEGARLVADDQTELRLFGGALSMSAPATIAGQIEVRGVGILRVASVASAVLRLVVDLVPGRAVERLPEPGSCTLLGSHVPCIALAAFEASAAAKLRLALRSLQAAAPAPSLIGT
jgi:HPr kinase/phosphorylase